jgi:hypothetical protein
MGGFRMNIFNRTTVITLTLIAVITVTMCTQQYDSESDFEVERDEKSVTITAYLGSKTDIRIPPRIQNLPVTSIGVVAFRNCASITSVTIPNTVVSIEGHAFHTCTNLASITIPDSVTSIGDMAFTDCASLTSITIPDSVTSIGEMAFYGCTSLKSVTIPSGVTSIGKRAFSYCRSLTSITIPNSVTSIGEEAFDGCRSLASVTFEGTIPSSGFSENSDYSHTFPGDLRDKFYATDKTNGTPGTYTTTAPVGKSSVWIKQP